MPLVKVNDTNVFYEDHGCGLPLLFLHGWGTSGRVWGHGKFISPSGSGS
jgi:non-heme chloroperoxidase